MWARKLEALAQTGLTYAQNPYDKERYRQLQNVAAKIFVAHTGQKLTCSLTRRALRKGLAQYLSMRANRLSSSIKS